jgi:hypothetical protein
MIVMHFIFLALVTVTYIPGFADTVVQRKDQADRSPLRLRHTTSSELQFPRDTYNNTSDISLIYCDATGCLSLRENASYH